MIRVALFTDEPIVAEGLVGLLSREKDFQILGVHTNEVVLPEWVASNKPDVLLMDDGGHARLGMLAILRSTAPSCRVALWSRRISVEAAYQALRLGARGILLKTLPADQLGGHLRRIALGEICVDESLMSSFVELFTVTLTKRESELLTLLAQGFKNREIASALSISEGTVKVYLSRLFDKTGVKDRYQLAMYGLRNLGGVPQNGFNGLRLNGGH